MYRKPRLNPAVITQQQIVAQVAATQNASAMHRERPEVPVKTEKDSKSKPITAKIKNASNSTPGRKSHRYGPVFFILLDP